MERNWFEKLMGWLGFTIIKLDGKLKKIGTKKGCEKYLKKHMPQGERCWYFD